MIVPISPTPRPFHLQLMHQLSADCVFNGMWTVCLLVAPVPSGLETPYRQRYDSLGENDINYASCSLLSDAHSRRQSALAAGLLLSEPISEGYHTSLWSSLMFPGLSRSKQRGLSPFRPFVFNSGWKFDYQRSIAHRNYIHTHLCKRVNCVTTD